MNTPHINANQLKWIALITMTIDHSAMVLVPYGQLYLILRSIGRLAFPIYAFLLVEGNIHTSNRLRYCLRLAAFAILSEVPFNLVVGRSMWDPNHQSIFVTLLLGEMMLWELAAVWEKKGISASGSNGSSLGRILASDPGTLFLSGVIIVITMGAASWLKVDYGASGILFIALIALYQPMEGKDNLGMALFTACIWLGNTIQMLAGIAFLWPIGWYDGSRGERSKLLQYVFYVYYPVHLMVLYGIRTGLVG